MGDLLDSTNRQHLEETMTKYFLVDSIRNDFGDLKNSLNYISEVNALLQSRESSVRTRVRQMSDEQLLHELVHAHTGSSSDTSQK
jgi:hypothetical protein